MDETLSSKIMSRLRLEAAAAPRGGRRLATLARLELACDDIASGRAKALATKADIDASSFGGKRAKINGATIQKYVAIRRRLDTMAAKLDTEWTGPHSVTIRADKDLLDYVKARQAEANGLKKPRAGETRAARIADIVAGVPKDAERMALMAALEDGYAYQSRYQILVSGLSQVPGLDVKAILARGPGEAPPRAETIAPLGPGERMILRGLLGRFQDPRILEEFGLRHDGRRVTMSTPPGTQLVQRDELTLLRGLAGMEPAGEGQ